MNLSSDNRFVFFDFIFDGKILKNAPVCGMTLKKCGNMRFRWNEKNELRNAVLTELSGADGAVENGNAVSGAQDLVKNGDAVSGADGAVTNADAVSGADVAVNNGSAVSGADGAVKNDNAVSGAETAVTNGNAVPDAHANFTQNKVLPVAVELIHSKKVIDLDESGQCKNASGTENKNNDENFPGGALDRISGTLADGIITADKNFMPVVTVADCMPIFLFDKATETFGIVHSGWKGTGIAAEAVLLMCKNHGARPENISVILGPHIRECCYIVNAERAEYFKTEFTPDCVQELEEGGKCFAGGRGLPVKWNSGDGKLYRLSLEKANFAVLKKCGIPFENINVIKECTCCNQIFGSNRRETAEWNALHFPDEKLPAIPPFTVQAAFIRF
jgi:polyphenol oxidase